MPQDAPPSRGEGGRRSVAGAPAAAGAPFIACRPARSDDLAACIQIWSTAIGDYVRRLNQPWFSGDLEPLHRLLAHFLLTDPDRFWVGTAPDRGTDDVIAFASATQRGNVWFLGMLFVLPEFQAAGVGRMLLDLVMPPASARADERRAMGTATDSVQPISNALYSRLGLVPRLPVFNFVGRPDEARPLPALPAGVRVLETTWSEAGDETPPIDTIDTALLGYAHPQDHAFLRAEGRRRFIARSERGQTLGYGYIAPSGRFGPVAAIDTALLAPITAHLLSAVHAAGAYATWIPGAADDVFVWLLRAGFRVESFPALLLWNRPLADFSRYVPINLALL